jgi:hypothetical protein
MGERELPIQFNDGLREHLRERGEPVGLELALTERARDVRMTVPKIATDRYESVPDSTTGWYLPDEHAIVLDLPEPEDVTTLEGFSESIDDTECSQSVPANMSDR